MFLFDLIEMFIVAMSGPKAPHEPVVIIVD
jgi:hypothetical protein